MLSFVVLLASMPARLLLQAYTFVFLCLWRRVTVLAEAMCHGRGQLATQPAHDRPMDVESNLTSTSHVTTRSLAEHAAVRWSLLLQLPLLRFSALSWGRGHSRRPAADEERSILPPGAVK